MIDPSRAMLRKLQEFFDQRLMGLVAWQSVEILRCGPDEEDDTERVDIRFPRGTMSIWSPHSAPPLGKLECRIGRDRIEGQLYPAIWDEIASKIRNNVEAMHV